MIAADLLLAPAQDTAETPAEPWLDVAQASDFGWVVAAPIAGVLGTVALFLLGLALIKMIGSW